MEDEYVRAAGLALSAVVKHGVPKHDVALSALSSSGGGAVGTGGTRAGEEEEGVEVAEEDPDKGESPGPLYRVRDYVDELLFLLVRVLHHFRWVTPVAGASASAPACWSRCPPSAACACAVGKMAYARTCAPAIGSPALSLLCHSLLAASVSNFPSRSSTWLVTSGDGVL